MDPTRLNLSRYLGKHSQNGFYLAEIHLGMVHAFEIIGGS